MANVQAIQCTPEATVNINVSSSPQLVPLGGSSRGYRQIEIVNEGTATVWYTFGDSAVTATTSAGQPILAGADKVQTVGPGVTHVAAIAAGSTGKIYFTPGSGL